MTVEHEDPVRSAEAVIDRVGREITLAIPIGIGKPNRLVNALYGLAEADRGLRLKIFTGLTLVRPDYRSDLERRFVEPLLDRLFPTWPELGYAQALRRGTLPPNVEVQEFFLQAGQWLANAAVQQSYASLSYSHVAAHLKRLGVNVLAQLVAPPRDKGRATLSLSCNPDVALDLKDHVASWRQSGPPIVVAGEINANLPYMPGEAEIARAEFDVLLDSPAPHYDLFAPPKERVPLVDYAMALHTATLIKDGGTLQIGIGAFADALCHALILRHTSNGAFRELVERLGGARASDAQLDPFQEGLYGCSEMLVDGFLALRRAGILKRQVRSSGGRDAVLHAGFFLGSRAFYDELKAMPEDELAAIAMMPISFTNTLLGDTAERMAQRKDARFVNTAMTATLLGAASADQLEDGRVVSGIGGQGDFVTMAHDLPGARSIIALRSTRSAGGGKSLSNVVWRYANASVPRQLRDIYVTEYGVADVRGKPDREVVAAMLAIADMRFQASLQRDATRIGKLRADFSLPASAQHNTRARLEDALGAARRNGLLPEFPFGTEMTETEQALLVPLTRLRQGSTLERIAMLIKGLSGGQCSPAQLAGLERLGLSEPADTKQRIMMALVIGAMRRA